MRILIESPSCNALEGSNAGVGYGWITALARTHECHVVVYGPNYDRGHPDGVAPPIDGVHPIRIMPSRAAKLGTLADYMIQTRRRRDALIESVRPDIVHSIEPAGWTSPRALATSKVPYVLGPLNGGSVMPPKAFASAVLAALPVRPSKALTGQGPRKLAVSLFNEALFGPTPTARAAGRRAMAKARRIILGTGLSTTIPDALADRVRRIVPQGIDLAHFEPIPHEREDEPLTVIYAGRLTTWKAPHLIIEALPRTNARLKVYGSAAPQERWYEQHMHERAAALGLADRVEFVPAVPRAELARAYASADVFCMLSLWEPMGVAYIEALASGTPIVGLATGGTPEMVTNGSGWLIEPTTPEGVVADLAARLNALDADRTTLRAAGSAARALAETRHDWGPMADAMNAVYAEIASPGASS